MNTYSKDCTFIASLDVNLDLHMTILFLLTDYRLNKDIWLPDVGFANSVSGTVTKIADASLLSVIVGKGGAVRMTAR